MKCYEYLATYVDDLSIAAQDPGKIIQTIKDDYKCKVKGDGPLSNHLGDDYMRDKDKTLVCQPKKYIDRLIESYHSMFQQDPPKSMRTPQDKNDHPELDDTEMLTGESNQRYLTMIGKLQWLVTLVTGLFSATESQEKLPSTSSRGELSLQWTKGVYYLVDLDSRGIYSRT